MEDANFGFLAMVLGVRTIHVSENDSQVLREPRKPGEFLNTWSVEGFFEEGVAPAEMGWGTHERHLPDGAYTHTEGYRNQICLARMGCNTRVMTWVPSGPQVGLVIRHGEAFTLSHYLTRHDDAGRVIYRPTVHYAYRPCDAALASLWELSGRGYELQDRHHVLRGDEILTGDDELGVLLMGHPLGSWWYGRVLAVEEARALIPGENATLVQVAAGVGAGLAWILDHPLEGVITPEDLDHRFVLDFARPYLGRLLSTSSSFSPLQGRMDREAFASWDGSPPLDQDDPWQFTNFLVH